MNTEHYFLVVATSKAADYSIYDISPLPCIAIMFYTRTHIFTFIFLFIIFFLFSSNLSSDYFFFYSSLRNRLLTSLLRLYMNSNKPFKHLQNNAYPCGKRILIQLKAVIESQKIYRRILETLIEFPRRIYYTTVTIISRRKLTPHVKTERC